MRSGRIGRLRAAGPRLVRSTGGRHVPAASRKLTALLDPLGDATAAIETVAALDSYLPSLMPRTSMHQGLASGMHVLGARLVGGRIEASYSLVIGLGASGRARLLGRSAEFVVGHLASRLPERDDEPLWRATVRSSGIVVRALAVSGAMYDLESVWRRGRRTRPLAVGAAATSGAILWAGRRLHHRQEVIPRWPVEQHARIPASVGIGYTVSA